MTAIEKQQGLESNSSYIGNLKRHSFTSTSDNRSDPTPRKMSQQQHESLSANYHESQPNPKHKDRPQTQGHYSSYTSCETRPSSCDTGNGGNNDLSDDNFRRFWGGISYQFDSGYKYLYPETSVFKLVQRGHASRQEVEGLKQRVQAAEQALLDVAPLTKKPLPEEVEMNFKDLDMKIDAWVHSFGTSLDEPHYIEIISRQPSFIERAQAIRRLCHWYPDIEKLDEMFQSSETYITTKCLIMAIFHSLFMSKLSFIIVQKPFHTFIRYLNTIDAARNSKGPKPKILDLLRATAYSVALDMEDVQMAQEDDITHITREIMDSLTLLCYDLQYPSDHDKLLFLEPEIKSTVKSIRDLKNHILTSRFRYATEAPNFSLLSTRAARAKLHSLHNLGLVECRAIDMDCRVIKQITTHIPVCMGMPAIFLREPRPDGMGDTLQVAVKGVVYVKSEAGLPDQTKRKLNGGSLYSRALDVTYASDDGRGMNA